MKKIRYILLPKLAKEKREKIETKTVESITKNYHECQNYRLRAIQKFTFTVVLSVFLYCCFDLPLCWIVSGWREFRCWFPRQDFCSWCWTSFWWCRWNGFEMNVHHGKSFEPSSWFEGLLASFERETEQKHLLDWSRLWTKMSLNFHCWSQTRSMPMSAPKTWQPTVREWSNHHDWSDPRSLSSAPNQGALAHLSWS